LPGGESVKQTGKTGILPELGFVGRGIVHIVGWEEQD
jgi:hypothetical protein